MLQINFDRTQFDAYAARFPKRHCAAMTAALRSESFRLNKRIQDYARSRGGGTWKFAPITKHLRKGRGYSAWVSRFSRYHVDPVNLTGYAGLLGKLPGAKFSPISRSFVASAARHTKGFTMHISGRQQRRMAKKLLNPVRFSGFKTLKGAQRKWDSIHSAIPKAGFHRVPARPFAGPVFRQEKSRTIRNLQVLYLTKLGGGRYAKTWMSDWGNE